MLNYFWGDSMTRVSCENEFCIYQKQGNCLLESVQLDIQGNCMECIYINIDKEELERRKKEQLIDELWY